MKNLRWQILVVLVALIVIGVILISEKPPSISILPGVAPATVEPTQGGVYREALVGSLGRLNPLLDTYNSADRSINSLLYSSLIRFDGRGQPYGELADAWGISQDGKIFNFSIRPNALWHDGEPVTTEDVIFTIDLMRNENIPLPEDLREFWKQVEIVGLDDRTLQFRLPEPFAPFLDYLTFGILPLHVWEQVPPEEFIDSTNNLTPIGSGPYKFESFIVEGDEIQGVQLASFEQFYDEKPFIDEIVFRYYPDSTSAMTAYQSGEVLGLGQITSEILPTALKEANLNLYTGRQPRLGLVYFNLEDQDLPFLQDANIRRALLMGINRQRMIDRVMAGQAILADGPILPGTWAYYDGIERLPFNPDEALRILKEAEYTIPAEGGSVRSKDGVAMEFELIHPDQEPYISLAQAIQSDWDRLGVTVNLNPVPYEDLVTNYLETGNYQAALADLNLGHTPDPDPYPFWHQAQINEGQNYARWNDRQASEYLEQARVEVDQSERTRRYRNFQVRFTNQMPALPLFYMVQSYGVDSQIQGVRVGALFDQSDRFNNVMDWFLLVNQARQSQDTQ